MNNNIIGIVGLGYVGLPLAVEFGKKYQVIGYDKNCKRISQLNDKIDVTKELGSEAILAADKLKFTTDPALLRVADFIIVTVPTPIDSANRPNLEPLLSACHVVGCNIKKGAIVIFESTVFPTCTRSICIPKIEESSGLVGNVDFYFGYSPERIVPGDKINTLTTIKKITSGSTPLVAKKVGDLYKSIITAGIHSADSIEVAEAAKVIENAQRDLNIAFVNELSIIFEKLGIDTNSVLEAAGTKWNFLDFKPGLVGGHCIGVDPYYLTHKAEELGYHPQVILAGRRINDYMPEHVGNRVVKALVQAKADFAKSKVVVFGVTFKENCPDVRNSKAVEVINHIASFGIDVQVVDNVADPAEVMDLYGIELKCLDCISDVNAIVVCVAHDDFKKINGDILQKLFLKGVKKILLDVKGIFSVVDLANHNFDIYRL